VHHALEREGGDVEGVEQESEELAYRRDTLAQTGRPAAATAQPRAVA